jgi:hypothetical protein
MRTRIRYTILRREETEMHFDNFSFGSFRIDDSTYEHDVVIDRGEDCTDFTPIPKDP